jgi:MFS family permease
VILHGISRLWHTLFGTSPNTRRFLFGTFLMGIGSGAASVHLNLYFQSIGLGEAAIGRILSSNSVGVVLVSLPAAIFIDRLRAERIFLIAALGFGAAFMLQLWVASPLLLMAASFLAGAFFTVHWVAAAPFFMRNADPEHRTELFGLSSAFETLATVLSASVAGILAQWIAVRALSDAAGLRWALFAAAIASCAAAIPFAKIRSRPFAQTSKNFRQYVYSRDMRLIFKLSFPAFLVGCGAGLTIPFLNLYFRTRFNQTPGQIGLYFSISMLITMTGFLAGPMLARRFTHVRAIVATILLSIPFFFVLAFADRLWIAVLAFWIRGALMNMNQPIANSFAMEAVDEDQQVTTNSVRTFAWNLSMMVSTPLGGWLIERQGYEANMFVTIGFYLVAASLFWGFFRQLVVATKPVAFAATPEERD